MYNPNQKVEKLRTDGGKTESWVVTCPAVAAMAQGDYIKLPTANKTFAVWLDKDNAATGVFETTTVSIPATVGVTQSDYFHILNKVGTKFAIWLDIDVNGTVPTGALYVASNTKIKAGIATGGSAIVNAAAVVAAIGSSLTGITVLNNLNGTITFTCNVAGVVTNALPKNADDSGVGSIGVTVDAQGVEPVLPTGAIYLACDYKVEANVATGDNASAVAGKIYTVLTSNADFVRLMDVSNTGSGTLTIIQRQSGNVTDPTPKSYDDAGAGSILFAKTDGTALINVQASSPASFVNEPTLIT